jgi:hypothetical protein
MVCAEVYVSDLIVNGYAVYPVAVDVVSDENLTTSLVGINVQIIATVCL